MDFIHTRIIMNFLLCVRRTYTEYPGWHCQWRPPHWRWWHRWAFPCVFLCWAPKCSHSVRWTFHLSFCTLEWSLLLVPSSPTCTHQQGISVATQKTHGCQLICWLPHINTHTHLMVPGGFPLAETQVATGVFRLVERATSVGVDRLIWVVGRTKGIEI